MPTQITVHVLGIDQKNLPLIFLFYSVNYSESLCFDLNGRSLSFLVKFQTFSLILLCLSLPIPQCSFIRTERTIQNFLCLVCQYSPNVTQEKCQRCPSQSSKLYPLLSHSIISNCSLVTFQKLHKVRQPGFPFL